jgi:hypothetical protein
LTADRYRTRVDANAAALELLCLACDDEIGRYIFEQNKEKLNQSNDPPNHQYS